MSEPEKSSRSVAEFGGLAGKSAALLEAMHNQFVGADAKSVGRRYSIKETAELVGKSPASIYRAQDKGTIPLDEKHPGSGRTKGYTLAQLNEIRRVFGSLPWRAETDEPVIMSVQNFKGGVGKSTVSVHLAQYLAQQGFRVLLIDADSQASATAAFGINPDFDLGPDDTILTVLTEGTATLHPNIRPTYWTGLDLVPANLEVYNAEYELAGMYRDDGSTMNLFRDAVRDVATNYDVVIIDPPPALGMISLSVMRATNSVIIPCPPLTTDFASTSTFLLMMAGVLEKLETFGFDADYKFVRLLLTKTDVNKAAQADLLASIQDIFGPSVLRTPLLASVEYENASLELRTIYEATEGLNSRSHRRARKNLDAVFGEIEQVIRQTWASHRNRVLTQGHD